MEKAFDRVWHAGLVCRLLDSDIPRRVVAIIRSFLLNRRFHVSVEGAKSSCRPIAAGPSLGFPRVYRGSHPVWSDRESGARRTPHYHRRGGFPAPLTNIYTSECCVSEDAPQHLRDLVPLQAQHKDRPVVERGANRYPPQALGRNGAPGATRINGGENRQTLPLVALASLDS
ncbi:unnamed protein product [Pieris brassicae]|uniref:Reverse transcriptase domain-containing protein n=1 Tax=Pieris brassicae TaxID=7116 RepID=A0A9P0X4P4_PIEBR|nr:unnamed protein product [Pieris brassicae]